MVTEINLVDIYSTALTVTATIVTLLFTLKDGIDKRLKKAEPTRSENNTDIAANEQYFSMEGGSSSWWIYATQTNLCGFVIRMGSILVFLLALGLIQPSISSTTHIGANDSFANGAPLAEDNFSGEAKAANDSNLSIENNSAIEVSVLNGSDGYKPTNSFWPKLEMTEFLYAAWLVWLFFCILFMGRLSFPHRH